jgi:hypothetical protein
MKRSNSKLRRPERVIAKHWRAEEGHPFRQGGEISSSPHGRSNLVGKSCRHWFFPP